MLTQQKDEAPLPDIMSDDDDVPFLAPVNRKSFSFQQMSSSNRDEDEDSHQLPSSFALSTSPLKEMSSLEERTVLKAQLDDLFTAVIGADPSPPICSFLLREYFHISSGTFRARQAEVCFSVLQGNSTLAVCPTGWGKSMCYLFPMLVYRLIYNEQLQAFSNDEGANRRSLPISKFCIVVSPLISLMADQAGKILGFDGLKSVVLSSQTAKAKEAAVLKELATPSSTIDIVFLSPEKLIGSSAVRNLLATQANRVAFLCIDEVHCVSKWAFSFRPTYLCLHKVLEWSVAKGPGSKAAFPYLCLTATVTKNVIRDLEAMYHISRTVECTDQYRDNLILQTHKLPLSGHPPTVKAVQDAVVSAVVELPTPTIVYVRTRADADEFATVLNSKCLPSSGKKYAIRSYHAALSREMRSKIQRQFLADEIDVLVATVAFGMGIDKPNIRSVVHAYSPSSLENYVQEVGRAGRDGRQSTCRVVYNPFDFFTLRSSLLSSYLSVKEITAVISSILSQPSSTVGDKVLLIPTEKIANEMDYSEEVVETIFFLLVLRFPEWFQGIRGTRPLGYKVISTERHSETMARKKRSHDINSILHQVSVADPVYDYCRSRPIIENVIEAANTLRLSLEDFTYRLDDLVESGAVVLNRLTHSYILSVPPDFFHKLPHDRSVLAKVLCQQMHEKLFSQINELKDLFYVLEAPNHDKVKRVMCGDEIATWTPPSQSHSKMEAVSIVNEFVDSNRMRLHSKYEAVRVLMGVCPKSTIKSGKYAGLAPLAYSWYARCPHLGALKEFDFSWVLAVVSATMED